MFPEVQRYTHKIMWSIHMYNDQGENSPREKDVPSKEGWMWLQCETLAPKGPPKVCKCSITSSKLNGRVLGFLICGCTSLPSEKRPQDHEIKPSKGGCFSKQNS